MDPQIRISQLSKELEHHNYQYYVLAQPSISDYEFDLLLKELEELEKQYPQYADPNSPTQKVGGFVTKEFNTVPHRHMMLSLANTYSTEELNEFHNRVIKGLDGLEPAYVCELKIDGLAISIRYQNGKLVQAITRGDGVSGDDVTENVKTLRRLPHQLKGNYPNELEVRGEIFMHREAFEKMNQEREREGLPGFANPRNSAAGTLKMQDSAEVAKRPLDIFIYQIIQNQAENSNHLADLQLAAQWGLPINSQTAYGANIQEVQNFINTWESGRHQLSYETDGVVIKINDYGQREILGFTAKVPRWAIAYKYKAETAQTILEDVVYQVGRTGAVTPVANLKPVKLAGTIVKRASLYNEDQIRKLDLRIGDTVMVEKGGEIIPKVTDVNLSLRPQWSKPLSYATHCPECNAQLVRKAGEAQHYCPNETSCPPQVAGKIVHFIGRKAMNIDSMGAETVELLYQQKLIHNYADLFDLKYEQLITLDRMADKSVKNILNGIKQAKSVPFERVLFALGIRMVGETVARKLAKHFKNIQAIMSANLEELTAVDEIGEKIAEQVIKFFLNEDNKLIIQRLQNQGLQFEIAQAEQTSLSNKLSGFTFLVSGVFSISRDDLKALIEANGGKLVSSVSSKLSYLVAGDKMGPEKLKKANDLGVKLIDEQALMKMLND